METWIAIEIQAHIQTNASPFVNPPTTLYEDFLLTPARNRFNFGSPVKVFKVYVRYVVYIMHV